MKKLTYLMTALCAAVIMQSCGGGAKTNSTDKADSANTAKVDSAKSDSSKKDSTTAGATTVSSDADAKFAVDAANGGMAEVALGKLAQEKTANAQVKEFANMMVKDHGKANDELMALAKSKNITLPATVSDDKQKAMADLSKKTGADFDKAYVSDMVDGHKKTIDLFEDEVKNGKDADLKAFATKTLPTIKMHLGHIEEIQKTVK
jgi:putative membrane protein